MYMDLISSRKERRLKHEYSGVNINARDIMYKPILITQFEITESSLNKGKDMLVAQVYYWKSVEENGIKDRIRIKAVLFCESYNLIKTIRGTDDRLPHMTKITKKKDGYYYFTKLNDTEKSNLNDLQND